MYRVTKRIEIAGQHRLSLPYISRCSNPHGHNWIIVVETEADTLNSDGMVVDFTLIKDVVMGLDHQDINCVFEEERWITQEAHNNDVDEGDVDEGDKAIPEIANSTAENIAHFLWHRIQQRIKRFESEQTKMRLLADCKTMREVILQYSDWDAEDDITKESEEIILSMFDEVVESETPKRAVVTKVTVQESEGNTACYIP